jgi:hypothetical protein
MTKPVGPNVEPKAPMLPSHEYLAQLLAQMELRIKTPAARVERGAIVADLKGQVRAHRERKRRKAA